MSHFNDCMLGIYEKSLPDTLSLENKILHFSEAGYDYFELSIDESDGRLSRLKWDTLERRAFRNRIESSGLCAYSICLSGNRRYPIGSSDQECRKMGLQLVKDTIDFALDVGVRIVLIPGYDDYYGESTLETKKLFSEGLDELAGYAGGRGVFLGLENIEMEFMNNTKKALEYVLKINNPSLKLYADIGNMEASSFDCIEGLRLAKQNIVAIHLKDARKGEYKNVDYGTGLVNFKNVFKQLIQDHYAGLFVAEVNAMKGEQESIENIKQVRQYLVSVYNQVVKEY